MKHQGKSKQQLIGELGEMRRRISELEGAKSDQTGAHGQFGPGSPIWHSLVANTPLLILVLDRDCRIRFVNRTDSGATPDQIIGNAIYDFCRAEDRESVWESVQGVFTTGEPSVSEGPGLRFDDQEHWYASHINPIVEDGTVVAVSVISVNVTDRKRAEEAIRRSETRYRRLYDSMGDAFVSVTIDGRIQEYNEAYRQMLGYEPEELAALTFRDLTPSKWHAFQDEIIEKQVLARGYSDIYEKDYRRKDGTVVPVELRTILLRDDNGQPCGMWAILRDITERKRAEEALRQSEQRMSLHVQQTPLGVIEWDLEFRVAKWNPGAERVFGHREGEALGQHATFIVPPIAREHVDRVWSDLIVYKGGKRSTNENITKDGRLILCEWYNTPLVDAEGQVIGVASLVDDITDRKRAEEALQCAHEELEVRVEERTAALRAANERLRREVEERRRAEGALRESHEQLQTIHEEMVEGLVITDIETKRFVRVNASLCRMLGYSEEELLAASIKDIHPPEEVPNDLQKFQAAAEGRVSINEDRPVLRKDGSIFYADITGHRILYNERPCLLALFRDVTERKQAEEALRASEERFRSYFEQGLMGMAVTRIDKQWREVNNRLCDILGYSREELLTMKWTDATHPDDLEAGLLQFNRMVAGEIDHYTQDKRFIHKNGEVIYATVFIRCFRRNDGTIDHILALIEDTTGRKLAEMALRQSEERYRAVLEDQTEVISRFTADGTFTFVNEVYCRFFGKTAHELLGRNWQPVALADDLPMIEEQLRAMSPDNPIAVIENRVHSGLGEVRWMQFVNRGFFDRGGRLTEVQSVGRDITKRKRVEEALNRERRTLKHLLQSSDHERQLIAYEIHDGLAQQLAGAIMQLDTYAAQKDTQPKLAARAFDAGMTMLRQGHFEARRLISGVRPPILDEAGIVAALSHLVNEERRKKGPKIEYLSKVEFERLTPILENAIYRIVQEGLANACRHSKSRRVQVQLVQQGDAVRIEVQDRGIGFKPEDIEESHFGVAGIRERARLLGGSAAIDSEPGKGTRIVVELPIVLRREEDESPGRQRHES